MPGLSSPPDMHSVLVECQLIVNTHGKLQFVHDGTFQPCGGNVKCCYTNEVGGVVIFQLLTFLGLALPTDANLPWAFQGFWQVTRSGRKRFRRLVRR